LFFRRLSTIVSTAGCTPIPRLSVYPLTICRRFIHRLPVCLSTLVFSTSTDCRWPFRPPAACLSVRPSACPVVFFSTSTVVVSSVSSPTTRRGRLDGSHRTGGLLLPLGESYSTPTHTAARGRDADFAPPPTTEDEAVPKIDSSCRQHAYRLPCIGNLFLTSPLFLVTASAASGVD